MQATTRKKKTALKRALPGSEETPSAFRHTLKGKMLQSLADSSSKAGHRIELPLTDVQPTSTDEPWPHSLPKPISKTSAKSVTAEQTPTSSQDPNPATQEQQPSELANEKVHIMDFQQELDGEDVSYEMRDGVPGLLCVNCEA